MIDSTKNIDEVIDSRLKEFRQKCEALPPLQIPEHIGQILLRYGFLRDLKGFNIKNGDNKNGNN